MTRHEELLLRLGVLLERKKRILTQNVALNLELEIVERDAKPLSDELEALEKAEKELLKEKAKKEKGHADGDKKN